MPLTADQIHIATAANAYRKYLLFAFEIIEYDCKLKSAEPNFYEDSYFSAASC